MPPTHEPTGSPHCLTVALVLIAHIALYGSVRTAVNLERAARRTVHLQAWQLRQLVS